jgi:hypothetical protein
MRALLSIVVPLALPTILYVIYMALARRRAGAAGLPVAPMEMPWSWLIVAGGILAAVTFVALYVFEDGDRGQYYPAQVIDGEVKPGYFDDKSD